MNIGVGLPNTVPGADGQLLVEWARKAEEGPVSSIAVLDRIVYDSFDPFGALAAAASVTSKVRLATMIAIGPLRTPAMLAKQAATVSALSGGRFTLGLGIGGREDDYEASGVELKGRGRRLSKQLAYLRSEWPDSEIGPGSAQESELELLVGGAGGPAFAR
ncbi:MAG: LLM class flavin-dependent oxidoreductase, partial [Solirubrobacterales bacterium]